VIEIDPSRPETVEANDQNRSFWKIRINMDDLQKLRSYVRESIKKNLHRGMPKDDLLKVLHSSSFYKESKRI